MSFRDRKRGLSTVVAVVAIIIVVAVLVAVLEAPIAAVSCTTQGTEVVATTTSVASTVTYTTSSPVTMPRTETLQVFNINPTTIAANSASEQPANLSAGATIAIQWTAAGAVNVYLLDSSQHASYSGTGAPSQSQASSTNSASGKLPYTVPVNDTYYLVVFNPGSQSVSLYTASAVASFQGNVTTYNTETTSSVTFVEQSGSATSTTRGAYQHTTNLLAQMQGSGCPS